ncbi:3'5'-cyclic nucleotide phosphodiesterase [Nitzschia inconspicua]|uniref:3'5'-cyclic nucleotide phosphodiesterase n=1 Tax=Nitzschia inconspicua TaxID=303405 RepID=A0A9K3M7K5_9STRA|nr:3'5'-cyclic nucleotide phosphodiesterase [Nitzschia inconspicua]
MAKGKGELQTYWLRTTSPSEFNGSVFREGHEGSSSDSGVSVSMGNQISHEVLDEKDQRLISWNVQRFTGLLEAIAASRGEKMMVDDDPSCSTFSTDAASISSSSNSTALPFEEVKEVIRLSILPPTRLSTSVSSSSNKNPIDPEAITQLEEYITLVSQMYERHPFHCFEHASHVTMSVLKMMSRFESTRNSWNSNKICGNVFEIKEDSQEDGLLGCYNFASDPLTLFSCAFSALIHDVLHPGVPNGQLMKEDPEVADHYKHRSVAEQRSFDVAYGLLMESKFDALRKAIYQNRAEETKFRQLVLNSVMATDVFDPDLKRLRNDRWEKAFGEQQGDYDMTEVVDRQATIVIEHLIQASDVAHTMQHWNVYRKWNQRLFDEMYRAYLDGRSGNDPSEFWYKGEIAFFDHYVIPLAEKLKDCGAFGVSSAEYLDFALKNRKEWECKGETIVEGMKATYRKAIGKSADSSRHCS